MWRCVSSRCQGDASAVAGIGGVGTSPSLSSAPALTVAALHVGPLAPLFLHCRACSLRMVACECCHMLLSADREVDGVLLCNRCGFLTVLDPKMRALVQIPPFSREILTCISPSLTELERLRAQWTEWETRLRLAQQRALSEGNGDAESAGDGTPTHKKRRRGGDEAGPMSEPVLPPTPPPGRSGNSMPPQLKAEGKQIQSEINAIKRQWQRLLEDAATGAATARDLQSIHNPMFSSTHLNILRIMYEKAFEKAELSELVAQIEQFLLQQSMIVKTKGELLSRIGSFQQIQELPSVVTDASSQQAAQLMIHCSKEQVRHLQSSFDKTARPYLKLVGTANKHLFALYNAAQSLSKLQETLDTQAKESLSGTSSNASSPSLLRFPENSRKRRMFGSAGSSHSPGATGSGLSTSGDDASASRVQQLIDMRHRLSEIAKKVDVWRSLSFTIASTCVLSLTEISLVESPKSPLT